MKWKNVFILFGIVVELLALYGVCQIVWGYRREERIFQTFEPTDAVVTAHRVRKQVSGRGHCTYQYAVTYHYVVGGEEHDSSQLVSKGVWFDALPTEEEAHQTAASEYPIGRKVTAYYDPLNQGNAVLRKPEPALGGLICPGGFFLIGLPGCAYGLVEWMRRRSRSEMNDKPG